MIYLINEKNETEKLAYRIGQLDQVLDAIRARGMAIIDTEVDLEHKALNIRIRTKGEVA